ncbi:S41 family peptidase [Rufibacter soli]
MIIPLHIKSLSGATARFLYKALFLIMILGALLPGKAQGQDSFDAQKHLYFYHIWGFLKYQHPALATGQIPADSLFLRYLPEVDAAKNQKATNKVFQAMLNEVGVPATKKLDKPRDEPQGTLLLQNLDDRWYTKAKFLNNDNRKKLESIFQRRFTGEKHQYATIKNNPFGGTLPNEPKYDFPPAENLPYPLRMLALAKFKAGIEYLFPYKYLMDENWDEVISHFVPLFAICDSRADYERLLITLNAKLNDTQAYSFFRQLFYKEKIFRNLYFPPFDYQVVEDKILVTALIDPALCKKSNIKVGDVLEELDDITIAEWVKALGTVLSVSNQEALWHRVGEYGDNFLFRSEDTNLKVLLTRGEEKITGKIQLMNPTEPAKAKLIDAYFKKKQTVAKPTKGLERPARSIVRFKVNDTNRFIENATEAREVVIMDSLLTVAAKAKGLIFDMRAEADNSDFVYLDLFRKFGQETNYFARYYLINQEALGTYKYLPQADVYFPSTVTPKGDKYKGKVVILVNAATQGVGEWLTMNLQHLFPNSVTMGGQSAGADGDIKRLTLPGNYVVTFSGNAVFYPDHTVTQRKGLKVDQTITPTLKGILSKKDEVLQKAIDWINDEGKTPEEKK